MRQIVLDTETTGLEASQGHRVIEIGCVELVSRRPTGRTFHKYLCPDREVDPGALAVHGISNDFLATQPRFGDVADEFLGFIAGAELVIHNATFDVGFLDAELARLGELPLPSIGDAARKIGELCAVLDTLPLARRMHPGQRNSLDALCKRYGVDNSRRDLHGALLDARILADVYLAMTGGQGALTLATEPTAQQAAAGAARRASRGRVFIPVVRASAQELAAHEAALARLDKASGGKTVFRKLQ